MALKRPRRAPAPITLESSPSAWGQLARLPFRTTLLIWQTPQLVLAVCAIIPPSGLALWGRHPGWCLTMVLSPAIALAFVRGAFPSLRVDRAYLLAAFAWWALLNGLTLAQPWRSKPAWLAVTLLGPPLFAFLTRNVVIARQLYDTWTWPVPLWPALDPRLCRPRAVPRKLALELPRLEAEAVEPESDDSDWLLLGTVPVSSVERLERAFEARKAALGPHRAAMGMQAYMDGIHALAAAFSRRKAALEAPGATRASAPSAHALWDTAFQEGDNTMRIVALEAMIFEDPRRFLRLAEHYPLEAALAWKFITGESPPPLGPLASYHDGGRYAEEEAKRAMYEAAARYYAGAEWPYLPDVGRRWLELAAEYKYAPALRALARLYESGIGVPVNVAQAASFDRMAEEAEHRVRAAEIAAAQPVAVEVHASVPAQPAAPPEPAAVGLLLGGGIGAFSGMGIANVGGLQPVFYVVAGIAAFVVWGLAESADKSSGGCGGCLALVFVYGIGVVIWGMGIAMGGVAGGIITYAVVGAGIGALIGASTPRPTQ